MSSSPRSRSLSWVRTLIAIGLASFVAALVALAILWRNGVLPNWLEAKAIELYLKKVQTRLPFVVERIELQKDWHQLLLGRISPLTLVLRKDDWRVRLSGPLQFPPARLSMFKALLGFKPDPDHPFRVDYYPRTAL